jgi:OPA family glycerol-3-phosphate transporter-like MFS transporter
MGSVSDRSNVRRFMPFGLILTAICNFIFGSIDNYYVHLVLWTINGFIQGMGWAPCGRSLGHWFSVRERGTFFSVWNTSHNVGGGIAGVVAAYAAAWFGWRNAFYVPAFIAVIGAIYLYWAFKRYASISRLPSIEEFKTIIPNTKRSTAQMKKN